MSLREQRVVFVGPDKENTERQIFEAFCAVHPNFAGRALKDCRRGANPPDFLCHDFSGNRIGVELTEWVNESQIASQKPRQQLYSAYLRIISSERECPPCNIENVTLELKSRTRPRASRATVFRRELFDCIQQVDRNWDASRGSRAREQFEFPNYPSLCECVAWIEYWPYWPCSPSDRATGVQWIRFPARGGFYSSQLMVEALLENLRKKIAKYAALHQRERDSMSFISWSTTTVRYYTTHRTILQVSVFGTLEKSPANNCR